MRLKDVSSRQSVKATGVSQASILSIPISCDHRMKLCQEMGSGNNSKKKKKKKNMLRDKILIKLKLHCNVNFGGKFRDLFYEF